MIVSKEIADLLDLAAAGSRKAARIEQEFEKFPRNTLLAVRVSVLKALKAVDAALEVPG